MTEGRRTLAVWIATCSGVGYAPLVPGTAGSAVGVLLVAGLGETHRTSAELTIFLVLLTAGLFGLGVWAAGEAEKFFGRVDPGQVVLDEVVGQIIVLLPKPHASWRWLIAGFVLFRFLDVVKPFPARRFERLPGGWGIMLDDVAAGAYGLVVMLLLGLAFK